MSRSPDEEIKRLREALARANSQRDALVIERDSFVVERDSQLSALISARENALAQCDAAFTQRGQALAERNRLEGEKRVLSVTVELTSPHFVDSSLLEIAASGMLRLTSFGVLTRGQHP